MRKYAAICFLVGIFCAGPGATGLGNEYIVSNKWRTAHSELSPFTNPALIGLRNHTNLRYSASRTVGEFALHELGLTRPLGLYQTVGLSWMYQGTADYDNFDSDGETIGTIAHKNNIWGLSYAVNPWRKVLLGANVTMARQHFVSSTESGLGIDAGVAFPLISTPFLGRHIASVAVQNLLAPQIGEGYARSLHLGWFGEMAERRVFTAAEMRLADLGRDPQWMLGTRLGLYLFRFLRVQGILGLKEEGLDYYGGIAGVNVPVANQGRDLSVQYQFLIPETGELAHSIYVNIDLGRHREEGYARKIAIRLNTAPSQLYSEALSLFYEKKYWDAYLALGHVKVEFPDFFKIDWVEFHMARCLEELGMGDAAEKAYEVVGAGNQKSTVLPQTYLGLMRVYYARGDMPMTEAIFNTLMNTPTPDSIKDDAFYLMGQQKMKAQEWNKARELFSHVSSSHPQYPFALYSAAVAAGQLGNANAMRDYLLSVSATTPLEKEHEEILNKSLVMLGYLILETFSTEEKALSKAVSVLRRVPKTSVYYAEALVGLGWAAARSGNWNDCILAGSEIVKQSSTDPLIRAEGCLLAGYGHSMRKDFNNAAAVLAQGVSLIEDIARQPPPSGAVSPDLRESHQSISRSLVEFAQARQSAQMSARIDSLQKEHQVVGGQIAIYAKDAAAYSRHTLFARQKQDLAEDLEFLAAQMLNRSAGAKKEKLIDKSSQKQQEIDERIKALEGQMKQLE